MDLDKSRYLLAIADLKSFSRAAEACHISQPALTRYVQGLERELGVTLFDRSFSPVQLTYAGERYLKGLKRMMKMKEELDREMAEIAVQKKERLVVGMHPTRSYTWLPRVVPAYQNLRPAVEIRLTEGNCMELQQKLRKDLIDLIFICAEPILDEDIHFVPLCSEEMALVVSRQASATCPFLLMKKAFSSTFRPGWWSRFPSSLLPPYMAPGIWPRSFSASPRSSPRL